jgi:hypothetical protein
MQIDASPDEVRRRLAPSGFDMSPAGAGLAAIHDLSSKINENLCFSNEKELEGKGPGTGGDAGAQAESAAGDAFQRQIPALKKVPDVRAILAGLKEVCRCTVAAPRARLP